MIRTILLVLFIISTGFAQTQIVNSSSYSATLPTTCPTTQPVPKLDWPMKIAGFSVEHRPIEYAIIGSGKDTLLIFAGIHGDEKSGVELIVQLGNYLQQDPSFLKGKTLILLPLANPDGYFHNCRENCRKVDLNRNFDTSNRRKKKWSGKQALSEPEAQAVKKIIETYHPTRIVSIHQIVKLKGPITRGLIDYNGPAEILACRMSECCPLMIKKWGARPGSLGSYAGEELKIPIVTLEMHKDSIKQDADQLWKTYGKALLAAILYPELLSEKLSVSSEVRD
jgi:protein MpaA